VLVFAHFQSSQTEPAAKLVQDFVVALAALQLTPAAALCHQRVCPGRGRDTTAAKLGRLVGIQNHPTPCRLVQEGWHRGQQLDGSPLHLRLRSQGKQRAVERVFRVGVKQQLELGVAKLKI
jgi:hypothetical protein